VRAERDRHRGRRGLARVVARPGERGGLDVGEAEVAPGRGEGLKLLGRPVPRDRQVRGGRPEVLADRHGAHAHRSEVRHRGDDLVKGLAEPNHEPGLRREPRVRGAREDGQAPRVPG